MLTANPVSVNPRQVEAIASALRTFCPIGQVVEVRALEVQGRRAVSLISDDIDQLAHFAAQADRGGAKGTYFTPNPLRPDLAGGRASARNEDVSRRRWVLFDCDPLRLDTGSTKGSTTLGERDAAWEVLDLCRSTLETAGLVNPVVADSANGWHLAYPIDLANDSASTELVKAVLKGLAKIVNTETVQLDTGTPANAATIWKLYGTKSRKGEPTAERPHRYAAIVEGQPWDELAAGRNTALLTRLLEMWKFINDARARRPVGGVLGRAVAYIAKMPVAVEGQRGSDACYKVVAELVNGFGLDAEQCLDALQDWNRRCKPPWSEKELRHKIESVLKKPCTDPEGAERLRGWRTGEPVVNGTNGTNGTHHEPPTAEEPAAAPANEVATIDDLIAAGAEVRWLWPGWVQVGVLNILAAEGGKGKTRFCADLLRRIRGGLMWPDGEPITLPRDSTALWVIADNNHDEMVTLCKEFGIKDGVRINAWKKDPYGGVALDAPQDLKDFEARIKAVRPAMVIIDTVGNATDRNLSKQEDAKAFYQPLQVIARRQSVPIFCLTHLSAGGQVLGRRAKEKVRVLIQLDQPDPNDPKRKLWVSKSNSKYPPPLGVIMGDGGNEYDDKPPSEVATGAVGKPDGSRLKECADWLMGLVSKGPLKVGITIKAAEQAGYNKQLLYRAKDKLELEEFLVEDRKWWKVAAEVPS